MTEASGASMVTDGRWNAAQTAEAANWEAVASQPSRVLYELTEHSRAAGILRRHLSDKEELDGMEVGIGPLGTGFLAVHMAPLLGVIVGVEPLPMLDVCLRDKALQEYVDAIRSRVRFVQAKGEDLPFDSETFDLTCCINVVDHAQHPDAILEEIRRVTNTEGTFIFGVNTLSFLGRAKWRALRWMKPNNFLFVAHPHIYGWAHMNAKLNAQGWKVTWANRPSLRQRLAGHGRMSFWILCKRDVAPSLPKVNRNT